MLRLSANPAYPLGDERINARNQNMHAVHIDQQTEIGGRADGHDDVPRNPDSSSRKIQNDVHLFHIRTISKRFPSYLYI